MNRYPGFRLFAGSALLVLCSSQALGADYVIGRWCDGMDAEGSEDNRIVTFVYTEAETYESRAVAKDGTTVVEELSMLPGNIYVQQGNVYGDRYRIHRTSEDLQFMNNEGIIRTAAKMAEGAPESGCFQ